MSSYAFAEIVGVFMNRQSTGQLAVPESVARRQFPRTFLSLLPSAPSISLSLFLVHPLSLSGNALPRALSRWAFCACSFRVSCHDASLLPARIYRWENVYPAMYTCVRACIFGDEQIDRLVRTSPSALFLSLSSSVAWNM